MITVRDKIKKIVKKAVSQVQKEEGKNFSIPDFEIFFSEKPEFGDYFTSLPFLLSKFFHCPPIEIAKKIKEKIEKEKHFFERIEVAPPGYLNFFLLERYLIQRLNYFLKDKSIKFKRKRKKIFIEYFSINIAKKPSISHLRSLLVGHTLYNIFHYLGYQVIGCNYLGDWGTQFGNLIAQIKREKIKIKDLTLQKMHELYVKFHQLAKNNPSLEEEGRKWFSKMEKNDKEAISIWKFCRKETIKEMNNILKRLNIKIPLESGESFFYKKAIKISYQLLKEKIAKMSEGAIILEFKNLPPQILLKSDGTSTYFSRDLSALKYRFDKWKPDLMIYEVGADQKLYFQQLFLAAQMVFSIPPKKLVHLAHGLLRTKEGKLSTREGKVFYLEDILNEAKERAMQLIKKEINDKEKEKIAEAIGRGAVIYNILKQEPEKDFYFDWQSIFQLKGDSGPYLQYTFLRAKRILEKSSRDLRGINLKSLGYEKLDKLERDLLLECLKFPEVLENCVSKLSPALLISFALNLAKKFNLFYDHLPVLKAKDERKFRLALTSFFLFVFEKIFSLTNLPVVEKM